MAPSHVLVPLDGSPLANEAFSYALETFDSRITVLNVVTPMDASMSEGGLLELGDQRQQEVRKRADQLIQDARDEAESQLQYSYIQICQNRDDFKRACCT